MSDLIRESMRFIPLVPKAVRKKIVEQRIKAVEDIEIISLISDLGDMTKQRDALRSRVLGLELDNGRLLQEATKKGNSQC